MPKVTQLAEAKSFFTIAQYLLFLCSNLVSVEEVLVQRDDPVPPQHAIHGMCMGAHTHTRKFLSLRGKDTPGSTVLGKQVVLSSDLVHPLPNCEPLFHHLQMEIITPTSKSHMRTE